MPPYDHWVCMDGPMPELPPDTEWPGLSAALEEAFDACADTWLNLAKGLAEEPTSIYAHAPACAANVSDFGLMLAWTRLIDEWSQNDTTVLVICKDPWMFRHLESRPGVAATTPPGLWCREIKSALRGYAARMKAALGVMQAALALRKTSARAETGGTSLLVYGHPKSDARGQDGYFGNLMEKAGDLQRILHVDCPPGRASELAADGRTLGLHAWGSPVHALSLAFKKWRPRHKSLTLETRWLVRRAAALEGASGQGAMIAWQIHCQNRWLAATRPHVVAWPWENHAWERAFVRTARRLGTRTVGYQHSVIGRQMLNYSPRSNVDGFASIPDQILCTGAPTMQRLADWSVPADRMAIGGAFRFPARSDVTHDPEAPVFVALPFDGITAAEMVAVVKATQGPRFLVKDHPMTPFEFDDADLVRRTKISLADQVAVSAVVYAATTVGLEAVILGLPTLRFRPSNRIALDILPAGISVPAAGRAGFAAVLAALKPPEAMEPEQIFAKVDLDLWTHLLAKEDVARDERSEK